MRSLREHRTAAACVALACFIGVAHAQDSRLAIDDRTHEAAASLLRGLAALPSDASPVLAGAWPIAWPAIASGRTLGDLAPRDASAVRAAESRLGATRAQTDAIVAGILESAVSNAAPPAVAPGDEASPDPEPPDANPPAPILPDAGLDSEALARLLALDAACLLLAPADESRDRARAVDRLCALASLATLPSADPDDAAPDQLVFLARTRATTASLAIDCIASLVLSPTAASLTRAELEQLNAVLRRFKPHDPAGLLAACDRAMVEGELALEARALLAPPGVDALAVARDATRVLRARLHGASMAVELLHPDLAFR
ncbi:MAG: hypothetical protein RBS39_04630 [Phycisphaerales bacterium]|jgi:hypothetical protein|nr:hypothetical protein [Phycisphaerales bacterium]